METRNERERLPYPSEDSGDLVDEPATGQTDDALVAVEEGVPWSPPTERVLSESRDAVGPDAARAAPDADAELERDDSIGSRGASALPTDEELLADVLEALRASDLTAGERLRVAVDGSIVTLSGEVESVEVLDELLAIVGDVTGVDEVRDQVIVAAV